MDENRPYYCTVCGGSDFFKESGYFYCQECQTQCEDIREQVFDEKGNNDDDDDSAGRLIGTPFNIRKPKKERKKRKGDDFTSWEMYNFVLRGQLEELMSTGAPFALKNTVLQLWTYYLKKLEAAFVSKDERALPKLGLRYNSEDAKLLYGLKKRNPVKHQRNLSVDVDFNTTISSLKDWSSIQMKKKQKKKTKKALMNKVAEMSILDLESNADQSDILSMSDFDDTLSLTSSPSNPESSFCCKKRTKVYLLASSTMLRTYHFPPQLGMSTGPIRLERTDEAKRRISAITGGTYNDTLIKYTDNDTSPQILTRYKLVVILYLGLMFEGSKIQISDLLRWIREGHLSYYEAAKHLPDTCLLQGKYSNLFFVTSDFPTYGSFLLCASKMVKFLEMEEWPIPNLYELAKKYVRELQLPVRFADLIVRFDSLMPPTYSYKDRPLNGIIPNYEARTLAMLIIILKLLFGLDGRSERQISNAASQLNKILNEKRDGTQDTKLFVWNDWVGQIMCRNAVLAKYHFPTKHILCPEAYGNSQTFINYCKKWNDSNAGLMNKYNFLTDSFLREVHPALVNTIMSTLEKLQNVKECKTEDIDFPQCFTPYSTYIQKVLEKSAEVDEPLLDEPVRKILSEDFSYCDITYLLTPDLVKSVVEDNDYCLRIKNKSAKKKYAEFPYLKVRERSVCYKRRSYVAVTECNAGLRRMEKSKGLKTSHDSNINFSTKLLKRKKHGALSGTQKKRRKRLKSVRLYMPSSQYWVHSEKHKISEIEFNTHVYQRFPFSFSWLLSECAFVSELTKFSIYKEILHFEKCCGDHFK